MTVHDLHLKTFSLTACCTLGKSSKFDVVNSSQVSFGTLRIIPDDVINRNNCLFANVKLVRCILTRNGHLHFVVCIIILKHFWITGYLIHCMEPGATIAIGHPRVQLCLWALFMWFSSVGNMGSLCVHLYWFDT